MACLILATESPRPAILLEQYIEALDDACGSHAAQQLSRNRIERTIEVENLLMVGRLVTLAAMLRRETRGAHNREDYPELDESWSKNIVLRLEKEQMTVKMKTIVRNDQ